MPVFGAMGADALELLVARARVREVAAGDWFFREGDAAHAMFVIESGRVEVAKVWHGRELVVRELEAGDCFGEMALLDLHPRSASARALTDCVTLEFGGADLLLLFERHPADFALLQMNLARELSRRLRLTDEQLCQMWSREPAVAPRKQLRRNSRR